MQPWVMTSQQKTAAIAFEVNMSSVVLSPTSSFMMSQLSAFVYIVLFQQLAEL